MNWQDLIITVDDYPKAGIKFKDITPLLANGLAFMQVIDEMAVLAVQNGRPDFLAGCEARGFLFAAALAQKLGIGLIPLRKKGKLPRATAGIEYDLEYGSTVLEVHKDDIKKGAKILLVDDVLATGGTMAASVKLLRDLGAEVSKTLFLMELSDLGGREKLKGVEVLSLLRI